MVDRIELSPASKRRRPRGKILRVLIVEDTHERQAVLQRLAKDHAWIMVNTATRSIRLLESYPFDLIFLDYDLAGEARGDRVAEAIRESKNARAKVIVHSQSAPGAKRIAAILPEADLVPLSKITRNNTTFKRLREEMERGVAVDWEYVFSVEKSK
ncbi:MAG: response regulator [Deltaproteobacteria bacterium]|nr:MAG: response regulator [Deltaproteobacteria bacterium]